jgi:hypothetical protein
MGGNVTRTGIGTTLGMPDGDGTGTPIGTMVGITAMATGTSIGAVTITGND